MRRGRAALAALAALAAVASCAGFGAQPAGRETLSVFAAASLTEAFRSLAPAFERRHPGLRVQLAFAGSPTLAAQIEQGAPADVFASADEANLDRVAAAGLTDGPARVFARNRLEIAVAPGNPKHVRGLADLARPDLVYVSAAPGVPAGRYGAQALAAAGVAAKPRSEETDVKAVLAKVSLGEADAGIVYVTDVRAAGASVEGVAIPDGENVLADYPVAALKDARDRAAARGFVDFLLSAEGQRGLESFGFAPA